MNSSAGALEDTPRLRNGTLCILETHEGGLLVFREILADFAQPGEKNKSNTLGRH